MPGHYRTLPGGAKQWIPDAPIDPNGDPNQIVNDWAASGKGTFSTGADGSIYADPAPDGILDRIAQYAPYGIAAGFGYGALSEAGLLPWATGAGAPAATGGGLAPLAAGGAVPGGMVTAGVPATVATATGGGLSAAGAAGGLAPLATLGGAVPAGMVTAGVPATVATATGAGGGNWLTSLLGTLNKHPLLTSAGLNILGGVIASHAAGKAADQQAEAARQALEFEKERYGDSKQNFAPFIQSGQQANTTLRGMLMPTNGPAPTADNLAPRWNAPLLQAAQNNGQGPMVTLRAPTGEVQAVPAHAADALIQRGATRV